MSPRRPNGEGSIYRRGDGMWTGALTTTEPGDPVRRRKVIYGKSRAEVQRKLATLRRQYLETGALPNANLTVKAWLTTWLDDIASRDVKPTTLAGYRSKVNQYLIPRLGKHRLDKLTPDHVRGLDKWMQDEGKAQNTRRQAHVILAAALAVAVREGKVTRNAAYLAKAPKQIKNPPHSLSPEQIIAVKAAAVGTRLESRWLVALMLGLRQGECLGMGWAQIDTVRNTLTVTRALAVIDHSLQFQTPKSETSARPLWIPPTVRRVLEARWGAWTQEPRDDPEWAPAQLLWGKPDGSPRHPRRDYQEWHELLDAAGVPRCPLHVARHSAATALAMEGVATSTIRDILGHSTIAVTNGYIHPDLSAQRAAWEIADPARPAIES